MGLAGTSGAIMKIGEKKSRKKRVANKYSSYHLVVVGHIRQTSMPQTRQPRPRQYIVNNLTWEVNNLIDETIVNINSKHGFVKVDCLNYLRF